MFRDGQVAALFSLYPDLVMEFQDYQVAGLFPVSLLVVYFQEFRETMEFQDYQVAGLFPVSLLVVDFQEFRETMEFLKMATLQ